MSLTDEQRDYIHRIAEDAAESGARKALASVGLHDEEAVHDVYELRNLLDSWRATKRAVGTTITKAVSVIILIILAGSLGLSELKKYIAP